MIWIKLDVGEFCWCSVMCCMLVWGMPDWLLTYVLGLGLLCVLGVVIRLWFGRLYLLECVRLGVRLVLD